LPGLDMAFVLASALRGGNGAGLAAVGGIMLGGAVHTLMGVLGVAAILAVWPPLFNAMLLAGALYIGSIGWTLLRTREAVSLPGTGSLPRGRSVFLQGMLTCLLNPKAYVFMLAIFPQFLRPERGHLWTQAAALGLITAFTQAAVYGMVALGALRAHGWLAGNRRAGLAAARAVGAVLLAAAILTVLQGWA
jgi:threonine/homoserine/homoserine lactone efflux protein